MQNKNKKDRRLPGFYIALCCCVLVLGIAGYFSNRISLKHYENTAQNIELPTSAPVSEEFSSIVPLPTPAEVSVFSEQNPPEFLPTSEPLPTPTATPDDDYTSDNPDIEEVNASVSAAETFTIPVNGEILKNFSSVPEFNSFMGDWRTHNGIDISADENSEVKCAADGEVSSCISTVYGYEIKVTHSNGYETVYSQIKPAEGLSEGSNVRCGDVIGTVSAPIGEEITAPHLHFEVLKDGQYISPTEIIQ